MKQDLSNQLVRPRRDIFVHVMVRMYFRMQYELRSICGEFTEGMPTLIGFDEDEELTRLMLRAMARTVLDDDLQIKQISKDCISNTPMTSDWLHKTVAKMNIEQEFFNAAGRYGIIKGAQTFGDTDYDRIIHASNEEEPTVDLHDALTSIVLCILYPFAAAGMTVDNLNNKEMCLFFHEITGNVLEDALSVMYGTFSTKTDYDEAEVLNKESSLASRIESTCPDSLSKKLTLFIIDKVFRFVMNCTERQDISYFYEGKQQ